MPEPTTPPAPAGKKFTARDLGYPPYNWLPPELPPLRPSGITRQAFPEANLPDCGRIDNDKFEDFPGQEHLDEKNPKLQKNPHPLSDYSHVDPVEPGDAASKRPDFKELIKRFDPSNDKARIEELNYLERMNKTVGSDAAGFQRLKRAFDLLVCRTRSLLSDINVAIVSGKGYKEARDAYVEFVLNVDDREPHYKRGAVDIAKRYGYGRNIQWVFIDPVIELVPKDKIEKDWVPKEEHNLITGTTIVIKWNPHSSSSGIPIKH